ncbi:MAG: U2 snRNP complex subunit [Ramalina farinacea]|uniref:U2 small nuclear ribonucleoprotein A' n=1 Tax=Ramalina farinacea TaxID=258253 RepID=A0AA43QH23_9LECA|nr:U2 snRNP complex subunit [Ramalina farinacea]
MRLTAELIQNSLSYLNPLKDRELDLRGHRIPAVENLGVAKDQSDAIDLTDNDIASLANFPLSPRLRCLLLARNRVNSIQPTLANSLPNLETLILTANNFAELADLDPLRHFQRLAHLSLMENPVARHEVRLISPVPALLPGAPLSSSLFLGSPRGSRNRKLLRRDEFWEDLGLGVLARENWGAHNPPQHYRPYLIWRCPTVRFLDYRRVRDAERQKSRELFGTVDEPSALASKIMGIKSRTFDVPSSALGNVNGVTAASSTDRVSRVKLTEKEKKRVEGLIRNAKSLQEIARLEKELNEGRIPGGGFDAMEE